MDAKCNIVEISSDIINQVRFGLKCPSDSKKSFLQYYINSLNCDVEQVVCLPDIESCTGITQFNCNFYGLGIDYELIYDDLFNRPSRIVLTVGDLIGGEAPYTYQWSGFNSGTLVLVEGTLTDPTITMAWPNTPPSGTGRSSPVILEVTDKNGCKFIENCGYTVVNNAGTFLVTMNCP